jgi:putative transcriptional regulator
MKNCVAELREARGWSKVQFADRLGLSRQSVHAIESGKYAPSLPIALAIGKLFGRPVEVIFGEGSARRR